jgi:hypothetical protein
MIAHSLSLESEEVGPDLSGEDFRYETKTYQRSMSQILFEYILGCYSLTLGGRKEFEI